MAENYRFRIQTEEGEEVHIGPLGDVVETIIKDAQNRGLFDKLPGHGQPIQVEEDPFGGPEAEIAKFMKQNNVLPEWLEQNKAIRAELAWLRANPDHPQAAERTAQVNQAIRQHNRIAPTQFHIPAVYKRST